jgi:hypothetical protein
LLVVGRRSETERDNLWLVPIDGSPMRKLSSSVSGIEPELLGQTAIAIAPDGGSVAYNTLSRVSTTLWEIDLNRALAPVIAPVRH